MKSVKKTSQPKDKRTDTVSRDEFFAEGESFESLHEEIQDIKRELAFVKERLTQKSDIDYVFSLEARIRKLEVAMRKREKVRV